MPGNQERTRKYNYPILLLCEIGGICQVILLQIYPSTETPNERFNDELAEKLNDYMKNIQIWTGRRLNDKLRNDEDIQVNDKSDLLHLQKNRSGPTLKSRYNGCTRASNNPAFIAETFLLRI